MEQGIKETNSAGITGVHIFHCVPADEPYKSFCLSQHEMLKQGLIQKALGPQLFFEDDILLRNFDHLGAALSELPEDWDMLYLGANIHEEKPARYSKHLFWIKSAWTSHAIAYSKKMIEWIVYNYNPFSWQMYDAWLNDKVLKEKKCFIVAPTVAWQRQGYSELWGRETDYTGAFEAADKKLK